MTHNQLAKLCRHSYLCATFSINECEAIIKYTDGVQIIAFRGTETGALFSGAGWLDVVRDLRIMPWYDKDAGWCHSGFLSGGSVAAEFLADYLNKDLPVVLTGHSLGGALSLICAVKLQAMGFKIQEWVGFGTPKCQLSHKRYKFQQINYRYRGDIVPLMPRWTPYKIHHPQVWLCPDYKRKPTWEDHRIEHYIKAVQ